MTLYTVATGNVIAAQDVDQMVNWLQHFCINVYDSGIDNTGATDVSSGLQSLINSVQNASNLPIAFPPGTYLIGTPLTVSYPIALICFGPFGSATLKLANAVNDYIIKFTPAVSNVVTGGLIFGLTFDGNNANQTTGGGCILGAGSVQCSYDYCHFANPYDIALRLTNYAGGQFGHHNRVSRCIFDGGSTSAGNGKGLQMDSSDENYVTLSDFENMGGAGSEPYAIKDWAGIQNITGNVFVGGQEGIRLQDVSSTRVIGNTFDGVGRAGVHASGSKNVIIGNLFSNGSSSSTGAYAQCEIDNSSSAVVDGNSFTVTSSGIVRNCIRELSSSSTQSIVSANVIDLSGGSLFSSNKAIELLGASSKAVNNPGWNPVGQVTAPTFPATTVAATNTTGADVTAYIANGTSAITVVQVAGIGGSYVTTGYQIAASGWGTVRIPVGGSVKFTYGGGSPTWTWFGE